MGKNHAKLKSYMASQMQQYSIHLNVYVVLYYVFNYMYAKHSTYIQHSTRYSIFNFAFNIQLFILYSIPYSPMQIIYSTISTIYSTFNYSFNSFEPSLLLVSDADHCLLKTWRRRLEFRLRKQKLMKMTQGYTSMWSLTFQGFLTRFFKELTRFPRRKWMRKLWSTMLPSSIKRCVCFVYPGIPRDSSSNINAYDKKNLR